jgi:O-antigen/teichoic acid export membrane protein
MIAIIFGRGVQFFLAIAMLRVATTLLSPEEMGKVALVLTSIAFFAMFLINPVGMFINRRLHAWRINGSIAQYLKCYVGYLILVAIFSAVSLVLFDWCGLMSFGMPIGWVVILVCASLIFNTINQTSIPSLNMFGFTSHFIVLSTASLAISFIFAFTLAQVVKKSAEYWILGLLVGQMALAIIGSMVLLKKVNVNVTGYKFIQNIHGKHFRSLFNFTWPLAIAAGLGWMQWQGYRFVIESHLGIAQLGLFVAGYSVSAGIIAGFESILTTYFQPQLYSEANKGQAVDQALVWRRYASAVIPPVILTVVLIILVAPELTKIILSEGFQDAKYFVIWGALAEAARVLVGVYSLIAHINMRTIWLILPAIVGAFFSVGLSIFLIPLFGSQGVGMALVISGFVVVILLHTFFVYRTGGGMLWQIILKAGFAAFILFVTVLGLKIFFNTTDLFQLVSFIFVTGLIYAGLLFRLLQHHWVDLRNT